MSNDLPDSRMSIMRSILGTAGTFACHLFCIVILIVCMTRVIPISQKCFRGWNMALPVMTQFLISLSDYFMRYWYLAVLMLPLDALVYFGFSRLPAKGNWLATCWLLLLPVASLCIVAFALLATWIPFAM